MQGVVCLPPTPPSLCACCGLLCALNKYVKPRSFVCLCVCVGVCAHRACAVVRFGVYAVVKVALYAAEKLLELGGIPVTFSDSSGHVFEPEVRKWFF